jgi:hypothetical protein
VSQARPAEEITSKLQKYDQQITFILINIFAVSTPKIRPLLIR